MDNTIRILPAAALRGAVILPETIVHFDINRPRSVRAFENAMVQEQLIFLVAQRDPETEEPMQEDLYEVGTVSRVRQIVRLSDETVRVQVEGETRARLLRLERIDPCMQAEIEVFEEETFGLNANMREAMLRDLKEWFQSYCMESGKVSKDVVAQILSIDDIYRLVDQISANLTLPYKEQQKLLEAVHFLDRYEVLGTMLENEVEISQIRQEYQQKIHDKLDQNQKEYILREQMKLIREELGEDTVYSEADEYRGQVRELEASDDVKDKIYKEIDRFQSLGNNQAESSISRTYIETLLELPWDKASVDFKDLKGAFAILQKDHYGLEKVKERIMEYLAVRCLTGRGDAPILCLVGPPGTGKTSIARSVARAMQKKYVRICLGGVRDEAEIRGHRRTYVGAMPGRIIDGLKQAGVCNPLMLLDEIDKTSADYRGDTASALLEVLDGEQNQRFNDHYIDIPVDLSHVLFIATANDTQNIPQPLLDRMEVIELSSYTENEKEHIAREHLVPKQKEANGIAGNQLSIQNAAIKKIITSYVREAGVRNLEREIGRICRKSARRILEDGQKRVVVGPKNLEDFLGKPHYREQMANERDEIGIVQGLAWTSVGGETLQIEVNTMPGKGELCLTGQMGDVMKESARIGISYLRSIAEAWQISQEYFREHDIHIHIPQGAVPKDGPSAGITMASAMWSAITGIQARASVAMTGEITLRGRVLPIGGLKEKLLAAQNAKIQTVLVPGENQPDVEELSEEITGGLNIVYVETMEEVLSEILIR